MAAVTYTNRKGIKYYLHEGKTKTGKARYFMSKTIRYGAAVSSLPNGYEITEDVNGLVSVGKHKPSLIATSDLEIVALAVQECRHLKEYKVIVKHDRILIYGPIDSAIKMWSGSGSLSNQFCDFSEPIFEAVMRFVILPKENVYFVDRKHYHGDGGWLTLEMDSDLNRLCRKFVKHIGKESFYDLL